MGKASQCIGRLLFIRKQESNGKGRLLTLTVHWAMYSISNIHNCIRYLQNEPPQSSSCQENLTTTLEESAHLGITMAPEKTVLPTVTMKWKYASITPSLPN